MKKLATKKLLKKIKLREKSIKMDKAKLRHSLVVLKKKLLSPAVVGSSALVAGLTLGWLVPDKFRHIHKKSFAVMAATTPVIGKMMPRRTMLTRLRNGAALISSVSAVASLFRRR